MSSLLVSIHSTHTPCPFLTNTNPAYTHVSIAYQHPPNAHTCLHLWPARTHVSIAYQRPTSTHPCLRCSPAPTRMHTHVSISCQHAPMSPLLISTHPCLHCSPAPTECTHMSPFLASAHPWLHCLAAPTEHTPMSPFLDSTHPAHTHVSISDQQAPTNAHQGHCCASPGRGLSTSSTPKWARN